MFGDGHRPSHHHVFWDTNLGGWEVCHHWMMWFGSFGKGSECYQLMFIGFIDIKFCSDRALHQFFFFFLCPDGAAEVCEQVGEKIPAQHILVWCFLAKGSSWHDRNNVIWNPLCYWAQETFGPEAGPSQSCFWGNTCCLSVCPHVSFSGLCVCATCGDMSVLYGSIAVLKRWHHFSNPRIPATWQADMHIAHVEMTSLDI